MLSSPGFGELTTGAAGWGLRPFSHELPGVVGKTAMVPTGLISGSEPLVEDLVVNLVIISGPGKVPVITNTLQSEGSNQGAIREPVQHSR